MEKPAALEESRRCCFQRHCGRSIGYAERWIRDGMAWNEQAILPLIIELAHM